MIDEILRADLDAPRKQRHTVARIFHRPVEAHGADVAYGVVRYYVAARKPQILVESGKAPRISQGQRSAASGGADLGAGPAEGLYER
ncbi:hypothetical protein [Streptomyces litmocidini]|uniref:Uncharacterized protein n=1 Tax=Streptomyces litmocidini TaxID=67318 RepID=A0ABW7U2L5_9ACTN